MDLAVSASQNGAIVGIVLGVLMVVVLLLVILIVIPVLLKQQKKRKHSPGGNDPFRVYENSMSESLSYNEIYISSTINTESNHYSMAESSLERDYDNLDDEYAAPTALRLDTSSCYYTQPNSPSSPSDSTAQQPNGSHSSPNDNGNSSSSDMLIVPYAVLNGSFKNNPQQEHGANSGTCTSDDEIPVKTNLAYSVHSYSSDITYSSDDQIPLELNRAYVKHDISTK